jgi:hypothetical protein
MTWSLFNLFRRRLTTAARPSTKRPNLSRRSQLSVEMLEDRLVPSSYSIQSSFNASGVPTNDTLWFSSVIGSVTGMGTSPATITVTNQTISFTDSTAGSFNLSLPNAVITLTPGGGLSTTTFDTVNNRWVSNDPTGLTGNMFLSGAEVKLTSNLHGSDNPVTWSATFTSDTPGLSFNWAWSAAAYNSFSTTYGSIGVKPCDANSATYPNLDKSGTPESYKTHVVGGATGTGGANYTGSLSAYTSVSPTYTATYVTVAGMVYNDVNNNGVYSSGDTGVAGVTLTLTGTTTGGQTVASATTTTASDGTYSFTTDGSGNKLLPGTYQVAELQPAGFYGGSNNVGTDNGTVDGTLVPVNTIASIALAAGDNGINYNFGVVNPFTQVTPAYPYSSGNAQTNIAFNESEVLGGATVNVANGTLNMFFSDEHAMALGIRETDVNVLGNTTNGSKTVSIVTTNGTNGLFVGEPVSGTNIPAGATIASVGANSITISAAATGTSFLTPVTLTFVQATYPVSTMGSSNPASATNPQIGNTAMTGNFAAVDGSGRPVFPSLYVTDITANPNSTSGDWQFGGSALAPSAVFGSWKSFVTVYDETVSPPTNTATADADPTANDWNLGAGSDPVPAGLTDYGYGAEVQWNLSSLYSQGTLIPGHNYRFYFILHDGDQNRAGGDCGQAAYNFTYRGPVTLAGNVYKDVYGNGVDGAGDSGIGGVTMTLTGTSNQGRSVSVTTVTAADGTYSFTRDAGGNLLSGGNYQIAEAQPAGYLQGYNTVGLTDWTSGFQSAMNNAYSSGVGYAHEAGGSSSDTVFTGVGSLDTNNIASWGWATGTPAAANNIVDAFGSNFNDSLTGHNFVLAGLDRYSASAATTVGIWALQNSVSTNGNGTFSGTHTTGDLLFLVNVTVNGAASVNVYQWSSSGTLTAITPAAGATFVKVNTNPTSVPWTFTDSAGKTTPQAGELLEVGVDLNAIFGLTVPHFASFLTTTRSSTATNATLLDFVGATLNSVSSAFTANGTLIPVDKIGNIVAGDGQNGINYNFGEVQPVTLSGTVYHDINGNGVFDGSDVGIAGVTLNLTGTNNLGQAVTATTTTSATGTYTFTNDTTGKVLPPGTYQIVETHPSGYLPGTTNVGTDNGAVDGSVVSLGTIGSIVTHTGDNGVNYNFGEYHPVILSGLVYQDTNGNGAQDAGEPGMAGVTLTLTGTNGMGQAVTATTVTGAGGTYTFTTDASGNPLRPGTYTITETPLSGYIQGTTSVGTVNGVADGTVVTAGQIGSIAMTSGQTGSNYNFGNLKPVTVSGTVYQDSNSNNAFDAGEPGLAGVSLTLTGTNGLGQAITAVATTAANGTYTFTTDTTGQQLRPGTYQVVETPPSGYLTGAANVGTVNGATDGTAASSSTISSIALTSGQAGVNYNFGDVKPITISGTVYVDVDTNGILSAGDIGVPGVTLTLTGTNGLGQSVTTTATTANNGTYSFTTDTSGNLLRPGTYAITETQPTGGYQPASTNVGTVNGTPDGSLVPPNKISSIALISGQNGINYNFGNVQPISLSGNVYQDVNANGVQDEGEPGIPGVTMTLTGTNYLGQSITATTTTSATGTYTFSADTNGNPLLPGTYQLAETQPATYLQGRNSVGNTLGSAGQPVINWSQDIQTVLSNTITSGSGTNYGFTHDIVNSTQDNIFTGGQSKDTSGIGQWQWTQQAPQNKDDVADVFSSTFEDPSTGHKTLFVGMDRYANSGDTVGGFWFLQNPVSANANGTFNGTHTDGDILIVADFNGSGSSSVLAYRWTGNDATGSLVPVTIPAGDAYFFVNSSATSVPWTFLDKTGNTSPQAGELIEVGLDFSGVFNTNMARFSSFLAESRSSTSPTSTLSDYVFGTVNNISQSGATNGVLVPTDKIAQIVLGPNQSGENYNFGEVLPATVAGTVYYDANDNGLMDAGETGISGATLTLTGVNNLGVSITATTTSGANGAFNFVTDNGGNKIAPGTYQVTETLPSGYLTRSATVGTVNGSADGTVTSPLNIGSIVLTSNQAGTNYLFGNVKPVAVSGTVYQDSNGNNLFDAGEPGISGVTLTLTGTNDQNQSITATVTTGANGTYSFTADSGGNGLRPGTYQVVETQPSGYLLGAAAVGTVNGSADGTVSSPTTIGAIALASSQSGINYNFGDVLPVSVAGTVYQDSNANNAFNAGEPGIAGVTLTLTGTNGLGQAINTTATTAANGTYSFATDGSGNPLRPGTYQVVETPPSGYLLGAANVGTVGGVADGNAPSATTIASIALTSGQAGINYNFGDFKPVTLSGLVYQDTNGNNALDAGEPGLAGVTLTLTGTNGLGQAVTATAVTAANGTYSFSTDSLGNQLRPGTYQIVETVPASYLAGSAAVGTVNGTADGTATSASQISSVVMTSGQSGINYNFGDLKGVTISGTVYQDTNGNNLFDAGEPGISGVLVTLTGTNNLGQAITATAVTAANGTYTFSTDTSGNPLRPGTYQIVETAPTGYLLGAAAAGTVNGTTDGSVASPTQLNGIALISGQAGINYLFGDLKAVSVAGTVYQDTNGNNLFDGGEPGIAGVAVTLTGTNGLGQAITASATTGAGGTYSFTTDSLGNPLRPGTYQVVETQPTGYLLGAAAVGTVNGTADGNAVSATQISSIALTSGQSGINYNFGDYKPVTVGGLVYQDTNGNNALDAGEPGIVGVTVTLSGTNGLGQAVSATTTTAANGTYSFTTDSLGNQLRPGTYQVVETQPSGYLLGAASVGTVNGLPDGTAASATTINAIALTSGQSGINYNFGDVKAVSVSGLVYQDTNGNNVYDAGEPGISGVTLTLTGTNGLGQAITATTTSAANGTYSFTTDSSGNQLRPGTYQVVETQPSGYLLGAAAVGTVNGTADGTAASATTINSIVLTSGQSGINYLFGDVKAVSISGLVYIDTNGNNLLDAGELGLGHVTLTLTGTNNLGQAISATLNTAAAGTYSFTTDSAGNQLRPGTYQVIETQPSGYLLGAAAVGTVNGTTDGNAVSATTISSIALTSGQSGVNYNFGDVKAVTVAGTVYQDTNGNNAFNAGEPGIAGVSLTLTGTNNLGQAITATATTAANGTYSFATDTSGNQLRPGTYAVTETAPSGYLLGAATVGTVSGGADGTVASPVKITNIVLTSGQSGISYLFGDVLPVTLGGTVYQDTNGSNAMDAGEPGIAGVTLTLTGTNGLGQAISATTTTSANGTYSFTTDNGGNQLRPGTYQIVETQPSGYLLGAATVGTVNGTADGTAASATTINAILLTSGQAGINYNFGDYKPVAISGLVYQDTNGNNALDAGEPGIAGVTVTLTGTNGLGQAVTATTTTAANGTYTFTTDSAGNQLRPGAYQVVETQPSGYLLGASAVGTVNGVADGNAVSATTINAIALTSGQSGVNYNFGDVKAVSVSGTVYQDTNGNNQFDGGEPGIAGVTLTLTGTNNLGQAITATVTTGANGAYSFTTDSSGNQLRPGTYQVVETQPSGYLLGASAVGTVNGSADGTATSATQISSIVLTSGQAGVNYLFGDVKAVGISGLVYQDMNGNNVFDAGEPGILGVTVTLSGTNGLGQAITATATTAANGTYSFTTDSGGNQLRPGTYTVTETQPSGYLLGAATVGTVNGSADGSVSSATKITSIGLSSGQNGINYLFGDVLPVALSGSVYQDTNGNNVLDAGEPGIAGVTVTLTGTNGLGQAITATTTTGANGAYSFTTDNGGNLLRPGTYQLVETQPTGYLLGAASVGTVNGSADGTAASATQINAIGLTSGQSGINYTFGDYKPVSVSGLVYQDMNGNNTLDSGEPGIAGVTVTLTGTNGLGQAVTATTTTAANGTYSFTTDNGGNQLRPGTYQVVETQPSGYLLGASAVGTVNGLTDGTAASATTINSVVLTSGQSGVNYTFGDYKAVSISGEVYQDTNGNNAFDAGEPGIAGVTVTLSGINGLGQSVTATATTGANGTYSFTTDSSGSQLRPGTYQVVETQPNGYLLGAATVGTVGGTADGTAASATQISSIVLTSGQAGVNYLFGDYKPVSVAGLVYQDTNGNNAFDSGEPGIAGVTVTLTGTNGLGQAVSATTTTAANGTYSFATDGGGNQLRPGAYTVTETQPSGYLLGAATVGTVNGSADGTASSATTISSIALNSGQNGVNYRFGDYQPVTVSGLVYVDTNGNGALNSGEPGLAGVLLTLTGTNGLGQSVTATTTTAADGTYSFSTDSSGNTLRPGTYKIVESQPSGFLFVAATVGTVNGVSDGTANAANTISSIVMTSGQSGINYIFGDVQPVGVSGMVYHDLNDNSAFDAGEPGIGGVTVTLSGTNNLGQAVTATTTTASNGSFSLATDNGGNSLRPGTYQIVETQPAGYAPGAATVGTVNGTTDGTVASPSKITSIVVTSGQSGINYLFGDIVPVTVSGMVYQDSNGNNAYDSGEPGIAGVAMTLTGTNDRNQSVTATTTTAANGTYSFSTDITGTALRPGTYKVVETQPSGYLVGGTTVGTVNGSTDGIVMSAGTISSILLGDAQNGINYNFGDLLPVKFSGSVYHDFNGDGVFDSGDNGLAGITLTLTGTNGLGQSISTTTTTAVDGSYSFSTDSNNNVLRPGTYQVVETQPNGYLAGVTGVGTVNGTTDGTVVSSGTIGSIVLTSGQSGINYNFGEMLPVTISGVVYHDLNGNGQYDSGEAPFPNVLVTLTGTNGIGQSVTATATSASDGSYTFTLDTNSNQLLPGNYTIVESVPSAYVAVNANVGTVNGVPDGNEPLPDRITSIVMYSGQNGFNYDFGLSLPAAVAGYVYVDYDRAGTFTSNDQGLGGVQVQLTGFDAFGQPVNLTVTTDANGFYIFTGLSAGTYSVTIVPPDGLYSPEVANVGTVQGSTDGSANSNNVEIDQIALLAGQVGVHYNFGLVIPFE